MYATAYATMHVSVCNYACYHYKINVCFTCTLMLNVMYAEHCVCYQAYVCMCFFLHVYVC